jgi:hypothetical protein
MEYGITVKSKYLTLHSDSENQTSTSKCSKGDKLVVLLL